MRITYFHLDAPNGELCCISISWREWKSYSRSPPIICSISGLATRPLYFRARLSGRGRILKENVEFSFDIRAAFYQTIYFKFLLLVLVMGLMLWILWVRMRMRVRQINQIEAVKREENIKVRQTASEDFHDEVGNSLTRIQVLTDVLHTKLGNGHEEEKRIIGQIKENVSGLCRYRDILARIRKRYYERNRAATSKIGNRCIPGYRNLFLL